jgi:hypothetical protein
VRRLRGLSSDRSRRAQGLKSAVIIAVSINQIKPSAASDVLGGFSNPGAMPTFVVIG